MSESAKLIIEVTAGLIPGTPEEDLTRRWAVTSAEWELATEEDERLVAAGDTGGHAVHAYLLVAFRAAKADEYARLLRDPRRLNWVRTEWLWL